MIGHDVADLGGVLPDLKTAIARGALADMPAHAEGARKIALSDIAFLPVIPNPDKILCIGLDYGAGAVGAVGWARAAWPVRVFSVPPRLIGAGFRFGLAG